MTRGEGRRRGGHDQQQRDRDRGRGGGVAARERRWSRAGAPRKALEAMVVEERLEDLGRDVGAERRPRPRPAPRGGGPSAGRGAQTTTSITSSGSRVGEVGEERREPKRSAAAAVRRSRCVEQATRRGGRPAPTLKAKKATTKRREDAGRRQPKSGVGDAFGPLGNGSEAGLREPQEALGRSRGAGRLALQSTGPARRTWAPSGRPEHLLDRPRGLDQARQVDPGLDAHLVQHRDHVLGRDVAGRARRHRAAAELAEARLEGLDPLFQRGERRWPGPGRGCCGSGRSARRRGRRSRAAAKNSWTWRGFAIPVVSPKPTSSQPAAASRSAISKTRSGATSPS